MGADVTITGDGDPLRVAALDVTPNLLSMLGVAPIAGRLFRSDEGATGGPQVVVLGRRVSGGPTTTATAG